MPMTPPPAEPRAILVIRLSAIGDVVMASGILPALRRAYPNAAIHWLVEPAAAPVIQGHPELERVWVWPKGRWHDLLRRGHWRTLAREARAFTAELRGAGFDLALDLQGLWKSALWARLSGAPTRIGLGSREGSRVLMSRVVPITRGDPTMASEYRRLVAELGASEKAFAMAPAAGEAAREGARTRLAEYGVTGPYTVLLPFTTRPQKHWIEARWAGLADRLAAETGQPVVIAGGPDDRAAAARILGQTTDGRMVDLAGTLGLAESVALVQGATRAVGVDTGLTHVAVAAGAPTVALFGSTRPYLHTPSPRARVLYSALDCSPCRRSPTCGGSFDCMAAHSVDAVADALAELEATP